jgi:hypothetical protein
VLGRNLVVTLDDGGVPLVLFQAQSKHHSHTEGLGHTLPVVDPQSRVVRAWWSRRVGVLPIDRLLQLNPAWIRDNLGDLYDLTQSIKEHGVRVPILCQPDLYVFDGARRIVAAQAAGLQDVPVVFSNEWADVREYYKTVRELSEAGTIDAPLPMEWPSLHFLLHTAFRAPYAPQQQAHALKTRRARIVQAGDGKVLPAAQREISLFATELGEMFNIRPMDMKMFNDTMGIIGRLSPDDKQLLLANLPTGLEAAHLDVAGCYRNNLRAYLRGEISSDEMIGRIRIYRARKAGDVTVSTRRRSNTSTSARQRGSKRPQTPLDPDALTGQSELQALSQMLDNLSLTAMATVGFKPLDATVVSTTVKDMRLAISRLNRYIRKLTDSLETKA